MASSFQSSISSFLLLIFVSFTFLPSNPVYANPLSMCRFDQIYQLGDSISDTGNLIRESTIGAGTPFAKLPYGETYFKNATGRCSNGLLMIDYLGMQFLFLFFFFFCSHLVFILLNSLLKLCTLKFLQRWRWAYLS